MYIFLEGSLTADSFGNSKTMITDSIGSSKTMNTDSIGNSKAIGRYNLKPCN